MLLVLFTKRVAVVSDLGPKTGPFFFVVFFLFVFLFAFG